MPVDQLSATLSALADPTRRAILQRLADGEASVGELAEPFPISLQAVSKHLKVLERAGRSRGPTRRNGGRAVCGANRSGRLSIGSRTGASGTRASTASTSTCGTPAIRKEREMTEPTLPKAWSRR